MNKIIQDPRIRTYNYNAFAESIAGMHKDYEEWFTNNFIQLRMYEEKSLSTKFLAFVSGNIFGCHSLINSQLIDKKKLYSGI